MLIIETLAASLEQNHNTLIYYLCGIGICSRDSGQIRKKKAIRLHLKTKIVEGADPTILTNNQSLRTTSMKKSSTLIISSKIQRSELNIRTPYRPASL